MKNAPGLKINRLIERILAVYPRLLQQTLRGAVIITEQERYRGSEKIDGSYDLETGEVILWNPNDADEDGLFIVLTHEWGHKLYHEGLTDRERADWLCFRSERTIDFGLGSLYAAQKLPEEEYASLFSLVSRIFYWRKSGMKSKSKKLAKRLDEAVPGARLLIEKHIKKSVVGKKFEKTGKGSSIYHREVELMKKWIRQALS